METELITPKAHKLLTTIKWQILCVRFIYANYILVKCQSHKFVLHIIFYCAIHYNTLEYMNRKLHKFIKRLMLHEFCHVHKTMSLYVS